MRLQYTSTRRLLLSSCSSSYIHVEVRCQPGWHIYSSDLMGNKSFVSLHSKIWYPGERDRSGGIVTDGVLFPHRCFLNVLVNISTKHTHRDTRDIFLRRVVINTN